MSALYRYMDFSEKAGMDEMVTVFGGEVLFGVVTGVNHPCSRGSTTSTDDRENIFRPNHQKCSRPPEDPHLRKKEKKGNTFCNIDKAVLVIALRLCVSFRSIEPLLGVLALGLQISACVLREWLTNVASVSNPRSPCQTVSSQIRAPTNSLLLRVLHTLFPRRLSTGHLRLSTTPAAFSHQTIRRNSRRRRSLATYLRRL